MDYRTSSLGLSPPRCTSIRIYDNNILDFPDVDYPLDIEISSPKYEVTATFDKYKLLNNEKLAVVYSIYCDDIFADNSIEAQIKLDHESNTFDLYNLSNPSNKINNDARCIYINNDKKVANISYLINYPKSGSYSLPGIWIDGRIYPFDKEINVTTKWESSLNWIALVMAFLSIIFGQIWVEDIRIIFGEKFKLILSIIAFISLLTFIWLMI